MLVSKSSHVSIMEAGETHLFASNDDRYFEWPSLLESLNGGSEALSLSGTLGIVMLDDIDLATGHEAMKDAGGAAYLVVSRPTLGSLAIFGTLKVAIVDILICVMGL
jgi:hypothetical protein